MYRSRIPFALAGADHAILIEVGPVAMTVRSRGALGTEGGKNEGNNEANHMQNLYVCIPPL